MWSLLCFVPRFSPCSLCASAVSTRREFGRLTAWRPCLELLKSMQTSVGYLVRDAMALLRFLSAARIGSRGTLCSVFESFRVARLIAAVSARAYLSMLSPGKRPCERRVASEPRLSSVY